MADHSKTGPNISASLDRFGIKNILFITLFFIKWSRLETIQNPDKKVRFSDAWFWHKIKSENQPKFSFRMLTVHSKVVNVLQWVSVYQTHSNG